MCPETEGLKRRSRLTLVVVMLGSAVLSGACGGGWSEYDGAADATGDEALEGVVTDPDEMDVRLGSWKIAGNVSQEFIDVDNNGADPISLEGWTLDNGSDDPYVFPPGAIVQPGTSARLHARCGLDLLTDQTFFWCHEDDEAFDEGYGEAILIDPAGTVHADEMYQQ